MLTDEALKELETKYGRVARVRAKDGSWCVVFRKPKRAEYKRMRSMAHNPSQVSEAQEVLARATVVYPSAEAFDALLEDYPGIAEASAKALSELAGLSVDETEKA